MDLATVTAIRAELEAELTGRRFGMIFQLSKFDLAVDLRLSDSRYLFISIEPGNPRVYLIRRRLRDLERASVNPSPFVLVLRKHLSNAMFTAIEQIERERILLFRFDLVDEMGKPGAATLVVQLTGRSANLILLDAHSTIIALVKETTGEGQQIGDEYRAPVRGTNVDVPDAVKPNAVPDGEGISDALDIADQERSAEKKFQSVASAARSKISSEISKRRKLIQKLNDDRTGHGDADRWKRLGDLLLANVATARREGSTIFVTDYFDDAAPEVAIEADENDSITEAAEKLFKRYTKARNAKGEIETRLRDTAAELKKLDAKAAAIELAIADRDEVRLAELTGARKDTTVKAKTRKNVAPSGVRRFVSSDGLEILVGKKAKDNDLLTFRVAKSLDTWMHAADYPGSHVVIRNPNRKDIPHRTLLEAAQLAAFYSQGKAQPKAAVHYTQKKFVNKPKGAIAGLVSLASFKTILVEPKIGEARLANDD